MKRSDVRILIGEEALNLIEKAGYEVVEKIEKKKAKKVK